MTGAEVEIVAEQTMGIVRPRFAMPAEMDFTLNVAARYPDVLEHVVVEALQAAVLGGPLQPLPDID
jgi:hypothetical protein